MANYPPPTTLESPKVRFQLSIDDVENLSKLLHQDWFLRAVDAALAQLVWQSGDSNDPQLASGEFYRITGARDFVRNFMTLANVVPLVTPSKFPSNLNHEIYK